FVFLWFFFFSSRRRHTRWPRDWSSDVCSSDLGALVGLWAYGIKTDNARAKEAGQLELETLANTFLIYAPMQLIAGRQRPGEGTEIGRASCGKECRSRWAP